jgi:hypothetical protein
LKTNWRVNEATPQSVRLLCVGRHTAGLRANEIPTVR